MKEAEEKGAGGKVLSDAEWTRINEHLTRRRRRTGTEEDEEAEATSRTKLAALPFPAKRYGMWKARALSREARQTELPKIRGRGESGLAVEKAKEEIIARAKTMLFENKDYTRQLLSALRLSAILHERSGQIRFDRTMKEKLRTMAEEAKRERGEESVRIAEEATAAKARRKEKMADQRTELDRQLEEKLRMRDRWREEKEREKEELARMEKELESQARKEREEEERRKRRLKEDIEEYVKSEMEIREKTKTKETELEEMDRIYRDVAFELERMRKERERDLLERRMYTGKRATEKDAAAETEATGAQDEKLREFLEAREERRRRLLQDLLSSRRKAEEEAEARRIAEELDRADSFRRRCRKEKADRERNRKELREALQRKKNLGTYYKKQWAEKEAERKREAEVDRSYAPDFAAEDKIIDRCCRQVLRLVRRHDRPAHPVVAAVKSVRKQFDIGRETNLSYLKSNVPVANPQHNR